MRVVHNHVANGMGARNDQGFLVCSRCGQSVEDKKEDDNGQKNNDSNSSLAF